MVERPESIIVQVHELHLDTIFSNLIMNAKDALEQHEAERQKTIKVEIVSEDTDIGAHFKISVSDNGPETPEKHLKEIFEPFYSTKPTWGTGLGLGIVKRLVQVYGGHIEVESKLDKGTRFTITLLEKLSEQDHFYLLKNRFLVDFHPDIG